MENGNIQLRDWNTNTLVNETVPPQQLKKIYLDDMKMEDLERNFKWHKITWNDESGNQMTRKIDTILTASPTTCKSTIGLINTSTTSLDDMDFTNTRNTNLLTMNMITTPEMKFQHVDSTTTNMITMQSDIDSLTISLTTPLTLNNTEEPTVITTGGNVQTPLPYKKIEVFTIANTTSTPITITLPKMDTPTITYEEDTLPDLTEIEAIEKEANETSANMVDISDDEPTFLDEQVTISTNNSNDVTVVYTEPSPILKFSPLNSASREECGPLVHIHNCGIIQYTNIGQELIGEPRNVYKVAGDGNCYFRYISYALSGSEDHHESICNVLCNYISWFPGRL